MELTKLIGSGRVALDTAVFIYFIEEHPDFLPLVKPLFTEADEERREIVTSAVTLHEVLIVPYRAGNLPLADRYQALLTRSRGVRLVDLDRDQLRSAAQIRALSGMRAPDALQVAAALTHRCRTFVTDDRRLPTIPGLRVVQLSELLEAH